MRALLRLRPNMADLGSSTTTTSASASATPSWSSAASTASSTVLPVISTHSIRAIDPFADACPWSGAAAWIRLIRTGRSARLSRLLRTRAVSRAVLAYSRLRAHRRTGLLTHSAPAGLGLGAGSAWFFHLSPAPPPSRPRGRARGTPSLRPSVTWAAAALAGDSASPLPHPRCPGLVHSVQLLARPR